MKRIIGWSLASLVATSLACGFGTVKHWLTSFTAEVSKVVEGCKLDGQVIDDARRAVAEVAREISDGACAVAELEQRIGAHEAQA